MLSAISLLCLCLQAAVFVAPGQSVEAECFDEDIRLRSVEDDYDNLYDYAEIGSGSLRSGRVNQCVRGSWAPICPVDWSFSNAAVVCSQLGYSRNGAVPTSSSQSGDYNTDYYDNSYDYNYERSETEIYYNDTFECSGDESLLSECLQSEVTDGRCDPPDTAGVVCQLLGTESEDCESGEVRFVGGANSLEGRLEVCVNEVWGTVCDEGWRSTASGVVCAQAREQTGSIDDTDSPGFTDDTDNPGPIVLAGVYCEETARSILECSISDAEILAECTHSNDLILQCNDVRYLPFQSLGSVSGIETIVLPKENSWIEGPVLIPAGIPLGNVVLYDAYVVTEGYLAFGEPFFSSEPFFFPSDLIQNFTIVAPFFANVDNNLYENSNISYEVHSGSSPVMEAVSMFIKEREGVAFSGTWMLLAEWKEVPLFSGPPTERNTFQAAVITDYMSSYAVLTYRCGSLDWSGDATIGFTTGPTIYATHPLSGGDNARDVACLNSLSTEWVNLVYPLTSDPSTVGFSQTVYSVREDEGYVDVMVVLELTEPLPDEMVDLEVKTMDNTALDGVDYVGQQQNVSILTDDVTVRYVMLALRIVILSNDQSDGDRSFSVSLSLKFTTIRNIILGFETAEVVIGDDECVTGELRLEEGGRSDVGRVEVCEEGVWTSVCDDQWDYRDAVVVCNQLGLSAQGAIAYGGSRFGSGEGSISLSGVQCSGNEDRLVDCPSTEPDSACDLSRTAGAYCFAGVPPPDVCPRNLSCSIGGEQSGEDVKITGKELKCILSYDADSIDLENSKIDESFVVDFMSPGSLLMLRQLNIVTSDESTAPCTVSTDLQAYGDPSVVLWELGGEALTLVYLQEDGRFASLTLTLQEIQAVVVSDDYSMSGVLDAESAGSLQWLLYVVTQGPDLLSARCSLPFQRETTVISFDIPC